MTNAYPDDNPKTIYGDKKLPLHLAPMSAVHAMAEAFADGAKKYGPYNWREKTVSSTVYYAAALRHLAAWFDGEELAEDSGVPHLSHALACLAILIDAASIGRLNDNRPPKGASGAVQAAWANRTPRAAERDANVKYYKDVERADDGRKYPPTIEADVRRNLNALHCAAQTAQSEARSGSSGSGLTPSRYDQTRAPDRVCARPPVPQTYVPQPLLDGRHD